MLEVRLSVKTAEDLADIYSYSYHHFGEHKADQYYQSLCACFKILSKTPYIGKDISHILKNIRCYRHQHHVIYYTVNDGILIIRILHETMDMPNRLKP